MQHKLTYTALMTLFAEIATKSKYINHSFESQNEDPHQQLKEHGSDTVMIIEDPIENIKEGNSGARIASSITIHIVKFRSTKASSVIPVKTIKNECQAIALHVLSYLRNEMRHTRLTDFDPDDSSMNSIDFYDLSWHGYSIKFNIPTPVDLSFNESDWITESSSSGS